MIVNRTWTIARRLSLPLPLLLANIASATAGSLGGPLELQDFGSFFIGGRTVTSSHLGTGPAGPTPPGEIMTGQMYVQ
ncbi:MAG TPA: hypothetical protein VKD43_10450, partial [Xanthobacteraceae bacterium]|nr:hypothetical protein [Xanthobacteraceae bacterium]